MLSTNDRTTEKSSELSEEEPKMDEIISRDFFRLKLTKVVTLLEDNENEEKAIFKNEKISDHEPFIFQDEEYQVPLESDDR